MLQAICAPQQCVQHARHHFLQWYFEEGLIYLPESSGTNITCGGARKLLEGLGRDCVVCAASAG